MSSALSMEKFEIREVPRESVAEVARVWFVSFGQGDEKRVADIMQRDVSMLLGAYDGKTLCALTSVIDFEMRFAKQWVACGGIAGVATMPGYRKKNLIRALMVETLRRLHEKEFALTALGPFSYPFYERMGYAMTDWQYSIEIELQSLAQVATRGNAANYKYLPLKEAHCLVDLHERCHEKWNLSIKRNQLRWSKQVHHPAFRGHLFVHDDGYILWSETDSTRKDLLHIPEFGYATEQAFLDGLAFLHQLNGQYKRVSWIDGDVEPLMQLGVPYPDPKISMMTGSMSRVVNVDALRRALPRHIEFSVNDPLRVSGTDPNGIGPGELIQMLTGFWRTPPAHLPLHLHNAAGGGKSFSIERY